MAGGDYTSPPDTAGSGAGHFFGLYRLFGDATGNGVVDQADLDIFRTTFNLTSLDPRFLEYLDAENNEVVDLIDLAEFRLRYNFNLFP